jgi:hypothetical protein
VGSAETPKGTWRVELDPAFHPGEPPTRYVVFKDTGIVPFFHLDNRDAEDLTDALIRELKPPGYPVQPVEGQPQVRVERKRDRFLIVTPRQSASLSEAEALGLFRALAATLPREPE